jgi:hypothetical protein
MTMKLSITEVLTADGKGFLVEKFGETPIAIGPNAPSWPFIKGLLLTLPAYSVKEETPQEFYRGETKLEE